MADQRFQEIGRADGNVMLMDMLTGQIVSQPAEQMSAYEPTVAERWRAGLADALTGVMGSDQYDARAMSERLMGRPFARPQSDALTGLLDTMGVSGVTGLSAVPRGVQAYENAQAGDYGSAAGEAALAMLEGAPLVSPILRGAKAAAPTVARGARGLLDDIVERANQPGAMPTTYSNPIPGMGHNGGPSLLTPYTRKGSDIAERLRGHVSAAQIAGKEPTAFGSGMTNIKSGKETALSGHNSRGLLDEELMKPVQKTMADAEGRTLLGIVGDNSGRHIVTQMGDEVFETPINTQGGFQYIDRPGQGYAGAKGPTAGKLREAAATEDPMYITLMMGEQSPDFAVPTSLIFGQMLRTAPIAQKNAPAINEAIRNIGMQVKVDKIVNGKQVKNETIFPFGNFDDITKPGYFEQFVASLPSGAQRAALLKGLDKANLQKMGLPKVSDARAAMADENQLGMDWGSTGYRAMVPDIKGGVQTTTPDMSRTYEAGVNKVGPSYSFTGEGKGIPFALTFNDLASELRAAGKGGGLELTSSQYKIFEGSHKRAKQLADSRTVELVDTFRGIEDKFGREPAMLFARDVLKEVNITPQLIAAARKANAPSWMLAMMAPAGGLLAAYPDETTAQGAQ